MPVQHVTTAARHYTVHVGRQVYAHLRELVTAKTAVVVVTDENVAPLHTPLLCAHLEPAGVTIHEWVLPPGEQSKSLWQADCLFDLLASKGVDRHGVIVALGGGVVGDLAGFVASTWLRGVAWINCPTTLLSAVDAGVGGKTAVNHAGRKNCVGSFHQPEAVLVDTSTFTTLDERQYRSGLAESLKHGFIADPQFVEWHVQEVQAIMARDPAVVERLVLRNVAIKAHIVQQDELDRTGARAKLNFGHTIGHALEVVSQYELTHGECVALGMMAAAYVAEDMGLVDLSWVSRMQRVLDGFSLPRRLAREGDAIPILQALQDDKKTEHGDLRFVLPVHAGGVSAGHMVTEDHVRRALARLSSPA